MKLIKHSEHLFVVDDFWSDETCDKFISESEEIGYEPAKVQTENGQKIVESVRNNQRILFIDLLLAESIWNDLEAFVNPKLGNSVCNWFKRNVSFL